MGAGAWVGSLGVRAQFRADSHSRQAACQWLWLAGREVCVGRRSFHSWVWVGTHGGPVGGTAYWAQRLGGMRAARAPAPRETAGLG